MGICNELEFDGQIRDCSKRMWLTRILNFKISRKNVLPSCAAALSGLVAFY